MQSEVDTINRITASGVIAVMRKLPTNKVMKVARSLLEGGVDVLEVTLDTDSAFQTIRDLKKEFKDQAIIGAGTVLNGPSTKLAIKNGAEFIVSPILKQDVIQETLRNNKVSIPGIFTPTEMFNAIELGAHIVKVFPASARGLEFIKHMKGPFPSTPIIPTGGVDLENSSDFIKAGALAVGVGGNLVNNQLISENQFDKITAIANEYVDAVKNARELI